MLKRDGNFVVEGLKPEKSSNLQLVGLVSYFKSWMAWICVFLVISFTDWDPMGLMHHHQIIINFGESVLPHDGSMGQLVRIFTYMNGGFFMVKLCRQIDQSHGSVMATFCRHRVCHANPRIHQTFQVPKMEESKLYGSGLCKGKPHPPNSPK